MGLESLVEKGKAPNIVQPKKKLVDYFVEHDFEVIEETALTTNQNKWITASIYRHVATISNTEPDFKEGDYKVLPPSSTRQGSYLERRVGFVFHKEEFYVSAEELITSLIADAEGDSVNARYLIVKKLCDSTQHKLEIYKRPICAGVTSEQRDLSYTFENGN